MVVSRSAVSRPIWSASAAVSAAPMLPRPNERPIIMPDAMPALPGIARCAQTMELGCEAMRNAPERKSATREAGSVPACVKK